MEDALGWLRETGLCSLAPQMPISHPAPTLLEAVHGKPMLAVTLEERGTMHAMLARLVQAKSAVPLLLNGAVSEQPDYVSALEALPMLYALRGDRNWRMPPSLTGQRKVSNLALHVWQSIEKDGPQTVQALQAGLTGDLTAAALLRALCELWGQLRVIPLLQVDDAGTPVPAAWEILARRHGKQVSIGSTMGQPEALSGLLGFYLNTVLAVSDEEIVAHFAPLASHSKVREMLHSLMAMRQLGRLPSEGAMLLHLKDGLPEELLVEPEPVAPAPTMSAPAPRMRPPYAQQDRPRFGQDRPVRAMQAEGASAPRGEGLVRRGPKPPYAARREEGGTRPPRRTFTPRPDAPRRDPAGMGTEESTQRPAARPPRREFAPRPQRPAYGSGSRPGAGFGPKKFGDKKFGEKRFGDKKFEGKKFGDKKFGDRPVAPGGKKFGSDRGERPDRNRSDYRPDARPDTRPNTRSNAGPGARPPRRAEGEGFVRRESRAPGRSDARQRGGAPPWKRAAGAQDRPERREKRAYGDRPSGPRRDGEARGAGRGEARRPERGSERGPERRSDRGPSRGPARGPSRGPVRSSRPRPEGGFSRGPERGAEGRQDRRPPTRRPEGRPDGSGAKRFSRPSSGKPGFGKPRSSAPRDGKPSFDKPTGGQGGFKRSGPGKPSFRKPGFGRPASGRPAAGGRSAGPRRTDGPARQQRPRPPFVKRKKPSDGE